MDFSALIERTFRLVWKHKLLLVLGVLLAALSGSGASDSLLLNAIPLGELQRELDFLPTLPSLPRLPAPRLGELLRELYGLAGRLGVAGLIMLTATLLIIGVIVGVLVIVLRGGLIAASAEADQTGETSLRSALRQGWHHTWRLILIASVPAIPITLAAIAAVLISWIAIRQTGGLETLRLAGEVRRALGVRLLLVSILVLCPFSLVTAALSMLRPFADRACILEDRGAFASYRRGWEVLRAHPGDAILLALFQLVVQVAVGSLVSIPRLAAAVCIAAAPLLWVLFGIFRAYFLALWTLAWREWMPPDQKVETSSLQPDTY
jgi:hypothetical protein